eukprot:CAMPEP_0172729758 /NCGR_PEP_ID=MMETSP1074-20121228/95797_1 /TAXON_ID=2916 /ORGANISM="Ceratium fusus, Strain PA161109" /LENGTH=57 /DNA_ID=CAMNT_0013557309 /DNA_START=17 /DNA_END=186 /DNA_ORIENTATION=-
MAVAQRVPPMRQSPRSLSGLVKSMHNSIKQLTRSPPDEKMRVLESAVAANRGTTAAA